MKILIAASEAVPFAKTGGLADVAGALPIEYKKLKNVEPYLILPLYKEIRERFTLTDTGRILHIPLGPDTYNGKIWSYNNNFYFIECDAFFDRPELYGTPQGDFPDNAERFIFYSRAVLEACRALDLVPDIVHCNDWQTSLIPLYLKTIYNSDFFKDTASVLTIHNLGYQGIFDASSFTATGLGAEWFNPEGIEFYGKINFLKAGIISADIITTVSKTYSLEILSPGLGCGLEGVLKNRASDLHGVLNGIDTESWNPGADSCIPAHYTATDPAGKAFCKKRLAEECGLDTIYKDAPIIAVIGRLSFQKGLDLIFDSMDYILSAGAKVILLGKGEEKFHADIISLTGKYKGRVYADISYKEDFSRRIYAGSDIFLMPSRYEPCGLGQLIAMRYGTIPVARKTGGLADTIKDYNPLKGSGTGFLFEEYSGLALRECLRSALCAYADKRQWRRLVSNAMNDDFSWKHSAEKYIEIYEKTLQKKDATGSRH